MVEYSIKTHRYSARVIYLYVFHRLRTCISIIDPRSSKMRASFDELACRKPRLRVRTEEVIPTQKRLQNGAASRLYALSHPSHVCLTFATMTNRSCSETDAGGAG